MQFGCDAQGLDGSDTICTMTLKTRDNQASQCMQCLLSPDDATAQQNLTLNLVKALNITASFLLSREIPIISAVCVHFTV
jgi:hypothetical protein